MDNCKMVKFRHKLFSVTIEKDVLESHKYYDQYAIMHISV